MFKYALRAAPRRIMSPRTTFTRSSTRRILSTAPPSKRSWSWKSGAARWALAGAGIYYYNTSNVFAEEPEAAIQKLDDSIHYIQESKQPTVDAIVEEKRRRQAEAAATEAPSTGDKEEKEGAGEDSDEEAGQQGAFNPVTGEINWDCPCLGGMAHGPCGEEFKAAFSCFVYSTEEPKGVECIEKFKGMQDCFRLHPEMYGSELEDDEDEVEDELRAREDAAAAGDEPLKAPEQSPRGSENHVGEPTEEEKPVTPKSTEDKKPTEQPHRDGSSATAESITADRNGDEGGKLVPRAAHDATRSQ
ncbi:unnamed protein product [Diplocarpon coronariae]|uniref:Mitochondrial intermembrane space import and assembly protein 40 n=1 Tax=Diplocarpon coronariae TaxID=2795749 RepID=A0A218Z590_9HELO|nr:hypothetical protein B2J93_110 [Marssonina coronariae]